MDVVVVEGEGAGVFEVLPLEVLEVLDVGGVMVVA